MFTYYGNKNVLQFHDIKECESKWTTYLDHFVCDLKTNCMPEVARIIQFNSQKIESAFCNHLTHSPLAISPVYFSSAWLRYSSRQEYIREDHKKATDR